MKHLAILGVVLLFSSSFALADKIRVAVYAGLEKDLCPVGYFSGEKCEPLNGKKFDTLVSNRRIFQIRPWEDVEIRDSLGDEQKIAIRLGGELGIARRYRALERADPDSAQVAIIVVYFYDNSKEEGKFAPKTTGSLSIVNGADFDVRSNRSSMSKTPGSTRRAFDHAGLSKLGPEEMFSWRFKNGKRQLSITFE